MPDRSVVVWDSGWFLFMAAQLRSAITNPVFLVITSIFRQAGGGYFQSMPGSNLRNFFVICCVHLLPMTSLRFLWDGKLVVAKASKTKRGEGRESWGGRVK